MTLNLTFHIFLFLHYLEMKVTACNFFTEIQTNRTWNLALKNITPGFQFIIKPIEALLMGVMQFQCGMLFSLVMQVYLLPSILSILILFSESQYIQGYVNVKTYTLLIPLDIWKTIFVLGQEYVPKSKVNKIRVSKPWNLNISM